MAIAADPNHIVLIAVRKMPRKQLDVAMAALKKAENGQFDMVMIDDEHLELFEQPRARGGRAVMIRSGRVRTWARNAQE